VQASDAPAEQQPVEHLKEPFDENQPDLLSSFAAAAMGLL
jgi:hypothetical protein